MEQKAIQCFFITYLLHTPGCIMTLSSMYYAGGPLSAAAENQDFLFASQKLLQWHRRTAHTF